MRHGWIALLLLLASAAGGAADIEVAPRSLGPSAEFNDHPIVVADGDEFVVVWSSWSSRPRFARIRHSDGLGSGEIGMVEARSFCASPLTLHHPQRRYTQS